MLRKIRFYDNFIILACRFFFYARSSITTARRNGVTTKINLSSGKGAEIH